jgi:solute carrier family 12 (potassium/chloride transporters), member 9
MSGGANRYPKGLGRDTLTRGRPTFLTRTATDDAARLFRRTSLPAISHDRPSGRAGRKGELNKPNEPTVAPSQVEAQQPDKARGRTLGGSHDGTTEQYDVRLGSNSRTTKKDSIHVHTSQSPRKGNGNEKLLLPRTGTAAQPASSSEKLGTFSGVFVPTTLNVLSILMFIRWGFILGQGGVLGMMGMLIVAYLINLVTTMSISAVASNGTVRGGGAYYLISRSLGPEFGGSIGIVFYLGCIFNTGMNAVGLIDCLNQNFGSRSGNWSSFLPESFWWQYLWSTVVLLICTAICLAGSSIFARASNWLLAIVLVATLSIPLSALVVPPFQDDKAGIQFTGLNASTFRENLMPQFTKHAAGSQLEGRENLQDLFGILFPATGGIFAGASMSGDLKNPSKSIPRGTLYGLGLTFFSYTLVILAMGASLTRTSFYNNVNVIQDTNVSGTLILLGEFATSFFSTLMGVIGSAKLLQAIARDSVFPGLSLFGQGTQKSDEPIYAIFITYAAAQITMLFDINRIASFITMTYLMTFFVTNLACFLLKLSSAPNFRPSFHYFNWWTAAAGAAASVAAMFFVDGLYATGSIGILVIIFLLIHYTTPPKAWGDVSQSLIYHQVRKYLLRLRQHEHVKFWRPQILLFVNDPRRGYKLIQFCNSLKKGALFILGHVIVTTNFGASVPEARRQQAAWNKYIDFSKIKAFVNVAISPSIEWGARNIVLSAGLGGMRPNIVIMGFYNIQQFRQEQPLVDVPSPPPERKHTSDAPGGNGQHRSKSSKRNKGRGEVEGALPTDTCYVESRTDVQSYVMVLEDMLLKMQINVAIATGFQELELPNPKEGNTKKFIDLWPIQMSAQITSTEGDILTTNFDTYTLILQLGCILHTVPSWKKSYNLRVAVFVEYESDVEEERARVAELLENLRIEAEVLVFWLASGDVKSYQVIINGDETDAEAVAQVEKVLEDEEWWNSLKNMRGKIRTGSSSVVEELSVIDDANVWPGPSQEREVSVARYEDRLRHLIRHPHGRQSFSNLSSFGVSFGMRTHRLNDDMLSRHASHASASEASESDETDSESSNAIEETSDDEDTIELSETMSEPDMRSSNLNTSYQDKNNTLDLLSDNPQSKSLNTRQPHSKKSSLSSKKSRSSKKDQPLLSGPASEAAELSQSNLQSLDLVQAPMDVSSAESSQGIEIELPRGRSRVPHNAPEVDAVQPDERSPNRLYPDPNQRRPSRSTSPANFTSSPVPKVKVANDEAGPSIMFVEGPRPLRNRPADSSNTEEAYQPNRGLSRSIYQRNVDTKTSSATGTASAGGFPFSASIPISFNDLPSRAQHLILNELMTQHSEDTAVVFTTLPAPLEGTYKSESGSLGYVSDLEVLCGGLPPTLMVHSNSMTVTMNL